MLYRSRKKQERMAEREERSVTLKRGEKSVDINTKQITVENLRKIFKVLL